MDNNPDGATEGSELGFLDCKLVGMAEGENVGRDVRNSTAMLVAVFVCTLYRARN